MTNEERHRSDALSKFIATAFTSDEWIDPSARKSDPIPKYLCDELCDRFPAAENGPAHVVISDYNLEDEFINSALLRLMERHKSIPSDEYAATVGTLNELLKIPEAERCAWYADHPKS